MFSKVVPQIAALFEHAPALRVHALEIQLDPLCLGVPHLDGLVPVRWNSFESLRDIRLLNKIMTGWLVVLIKGVH